MPVSPTQASSGTRDVSRAEGLMLNCPSPGGKQALSPTGPLPAPVERGNTGSGPAYVPSVGQLPTA